MMSKALKSLVGIVEGIAIDGEISKQEISYLANWLEEHQETKNLHPYNEVVPIIEFAVSDGKLSPEEKEDVLWLCKKFTEDSIYYDKVTSDIQILHGILSGIIADGIVTEEELKGLASWLESHDYLRKCFPYDEIDSIVTSVMADGVIDEKEQRILMNYFSEFSETSSHKAVINPFLEVDEKIIGLCSMCPEIEFKDSVFCFTGASRKFLRQEFKEMVEKLGGIFKNSVSKNVDYLIVGADGNPCWAFACYGRKVEAAVALRKEGCKIQLIHEEDFVDAVRDNE